jgi:hypothetical protein
MFRIRSAIRIRSRIAAMMWGGISWAGSDSSGNETFSFEATYASGRIKTCGPVLVHGGAPREGPK